MWLPLADWVITAATAIVIVLSRLYARRHPKVPPG